MVLTDTLHESELFLSFSKKLIIKHQSIAGETVVILCHPIKNIIQLCKMIYEIFSDFVSKSLSHRAFEAKSEKKFLHKSFSITK